MPTKSAILQLGLKKKLFEQLSLFAKKQNKPLPHIIKKLIQKGLDNREDFLLSKLAANRELIKQSNISHSKAWD